MYLILNGQRSLDFVGASPDTPWLTYVLAAVVLFALAVLVRHLRITGWKLRTRTASL